MGVLLRRREIEMIKKHVPWGTDDRVGDLINESRQSLR
jgi:hypothetical protein